MFIKKTLESNISLVNDPSAWSIRVDRSYRIAHLPGGNPDWAADIAILRILTHDVLCRHPR